MNITNVINTSNMTKEEILSKYAITNYYGIEFVKPHNCLQAMQEYADQQTKELKQRVEELNGKIELSKNLKWLIMLVSME